MQNTTNQTTSAARDAGQRKVRFTCSHVAHEIRGDMDVLSGRTRHILAGETATVLRFANSRSTRKDRVLLKLDDGMFAWFDTSLTENVHP